MQQLAGKRIALTMAHPVFKHHAGYARFAVGRNVTKVQAKVPDPPSEVGELQYVRVAKTVNPTRSDWSTFGSYQKESPQKTFTNKMVIQGSIYQQRQTSQNALSSKKVFKTTFTRRTQTSILELVEHFLPKFYPKAARPPIYLPDTQRHLI